MIGADNIVGLSVTMTFAQGELVRSLAFSPDGAVLAAAVGDLAGTVQLYETASGNALRALEGHQSIVWGLAFSPDGRFLASASRDHTARVWDWRSGSLIQSIAFPNEAVSVAFSPDSQTLAVGGVEAWPNATIRTYAVGSWQPLLKLAEYWDIPAIAFSPDGSLIVGGGTSRNVRVWKASDGAEQSVLNHPGQVSSIAISPDGSTVATGLCRATQGSQCTAGAIWLWNLETGRLIGELSDFPQVVEAVAFSADGSLILGASRDGSVRAYATSNLRPLLVTSIPPGPSASSVLALAVSRDGRVMATGGSGRIDLWSIRQ